MSRETVFGDLSAPRFNKRKFRENILSESLYRDWRQSTGYTLSFADFKSIWNDIALKMVDKILEERDGLKLGNGLGDVFIATTPVKSRRPVDYKTSRALGKYVFHENWNTDGRVGKVIYSTGNKKYTYRLSGYWAFEAHRNFSRRTSKALQENPERYKNAKDRKIRIGNYTAKPTTDNVNNNKG